MSFTQITTSLPKQFSHPISSGGYGPLFVVMSEKWTIDQYRAHIGKPQNKSKYGSQKTVEDGITFDSKLEARHYREYRIQLLNGEIAGYSRQVTFILQTRPNPIKYVADHLIIRLDGSIHVVDSKGKETDQFRLKRKLFIQQYPHISFEVRKK